MDPVETYRTKAREAREAAQSIAEGEARDALMKIANDFDRLAERAAINPTKDEH